MAKVIVYLRVSTKDQAVENQLPALEEWIKSRGHTLVKVYQESESAWRKGHQHELARLIKDLPRYCPDILLVWALDRLTREGIGPILQLVTKFKAHGVQVVSKQESWTEQAGPMLELLYAVTAWAGNYESTRISERVLAGLSRAKSKGSILGRRQGSKDKGKRKRTGYLLRYATKKTADKNDDGAGVANG